MLMMTSNAVALLGIGIHLDDISFDVMCIVCLNFNVKMAKPLHGWSIILTIKNLGRLD